MQESSTHDTFGLHIRRLRKEHKWTQEDLAKKLNVDRTAVSRMESGKKPSDDIVKRLEELYGLNPGTLGQNMAIAIPDLSALLKNKKILDHLLDVYELVIIPDVVQLELSKLKNLKRSDELTNEERRNRKNASQLLEIILQYLNDQQYSKGIKEVVKKGRLERWETTNYDLSQYGESHLTEGRIIELAKDLQNSTMMQVEIIHADRDYPSLCSNELHSLRLEEFMTTRLGEKSISQDLIDFDLEFDQLDYYADKLDKCNIDAYLPDGMTLLISCIRCNDPEKLKERHGRYIPAAKMQKKLQFILDHGANPNIPDNNQRCHTPLEHCVEIIPSDFVAFCMLLEHGADYNKGSVDETKDINRRISVINEGNTPLMVACWNGEKEFVQKLLEQKDLSINQQDCNGYTALTKCARKRFKQIERGNEYKVFEEIYHMLLAANADTRIRDRKNRTAADWWNDGNKLLEEAQDDE